MKEFDLVEQVDDSAHSEVPSSMPSPPVGYRLSHFASQLRGGDLQEGALVWMVARGWEPVRYGMLYEDCHFAFPAVTAADAPNLSGSEEKELEPTSTNPKTTFTAPQGDSQ
jgi:hypothetical protein